MGARCSRRSTYEANPARKSLPTTPRLLAKGEKNKLKKTWIAMAGNQEDFIRQVWLTSSERSPRVKSILGLDEGADHRRFDILTKGVRAFFDELIVKHELSDERVLESCYNLGVRHAQFHDNVFQPVYWDIFLVSLVDTMERWEFNVNIDKRWQVVYVWQKFVYLVTNQMLEAYRSVRIGESVLVAA